MHTKEEILNWPWGIQFGITSLTQKLKRPTCSRGFGLLQGQPILFSIYYYILSSTADGDRSNDIKGYLLFGRKAMTNLDSVLKNKGNPLLTKIRIVEAVVFQQSCTDVRVGP